jgi:hypothetical protein
MTASGITRVGYRLGRGTDPRNEDGSEAWRYLDKEPLARKLDSCLVTAMVIPALAPGSTKLAPASVMYGK